MQTAGRLYPRAVTEWRRRLLIVDDEALVRTLLSDALSAAGFEVATAVNAAEARKSVHDFDPDVAVIDIHLGSGPSGLHLGHALHRGHPEIGLVFLTKYHDRNAGGLDGWDVPPGSAFLAKDHINDAQALTEAIESVLRGGSPPDERSEGPLSVLTSTQLEILRLAALGLTNASIAKSRNTQEGTVEQRLQAIYSALGIAITGEWPVRAPDGSVRPSRGRIGTGCAASAARTATRPSPSRSTTTTPRPAG